MMNISTKFDVGDKVWKIVRSRPKVWEPCTFCGGTPGPVESFSDRQTVVLGLDGTKKRCPECYGRGGGVKYLELEWYVRDECPYTVGQIRVQLGYDPEETYMCRETGVGSGQVHNAKDLFVTREEAVAECAIRNSEAQP